QGILRPLCWLRRCDREAVMRLDSCSEAELWMSTGIFGSSGVGDVVERHAGDAARGNAWPSGFWTMSTTRSSQPVLFNADGAFLVEADGKVVKLADKPVSVPLAVRMSCTIPGFISAFKYRGHFLFDGALSRDGLCPVGVLIRHFGFDAKKIIACRVGEDSLHPFFGPLHSLCRRLWGTPSERHWGEESSGVIAFRPQIDHVHTLKLRLSRDEKWLAILTSYEACVSRLAMEGILKDEALLKVRSLLQDLGNWRDVIPAAPGASQWFSKRVESCLTEYGCF
ncbi:MAG: hypothetical protein K2X27_25710, partial [Candidatus Obscuribacterales bacterium]|nr:hypothetical protein [Candidatus Obscuribacterales bacterium]